MSKKIKIQFQSKNLHKKLFNSIDFQSLGLFPEMIKDKLKNLDD